MQSTCQTEATVPLTPQDGILTGGTFIKKRPSRYSSSQVCEWLRVICFPGHWSEDDIDNGRFPATLANLERIILHQLVTFPYENSPMHFTASHVMDISPQYNYQRLVVERQGSYCFGLNGVLYEMLLGLGYRAYAAGSRINEDQSVPPRYTGFVHMVILVQPLEDSNLTYLVDVGCAGSGPLRPILLSTSDDNVVEGTTPTERHRLRRGLLPDTNPDDAGTEWRLEVCHDKPGASGKWRIMFSFSEAERSPDEFEEANRTVYTACQGMFWDNVLCTRHFWLDPQQTAALEGVDPSNLSEASTRYLGRLAMDRNVLKRLIGSQVEILQTVSSEGERAQLLLDTFGVCIKEEDFVHIEGRPAALSQ